MGSFSSYLNSLGMGALWETLQQDEALLALVRTPLLLSVSILANESWMQRNGSGRRRPRRGWTIC
jgi:hypothetical protein